MAVQKAAGALMDARAAAEAEGIYEPTAEQKEMLKRYKALKDRKNAIEAEMSAIESVIRADMDEYGKNAIAFNGKNWVLVSGVGATEVYTDQMEMTYPEVVATYVEAKREYDKKAAEFTFRVVKPRARATFKPV